MTDDGDEGSDSEEYYSYWSRRASRRTRYALTLLPITARELQLLQLVPRPYDLLFLLEPCCD
jgi:hypothetical protein